MERCPDCNTPAPWCWLRDSGRCPLRAEPLWAAHNAARSPLGPGPTPPASPPAVGPPANRFAGPFLLVLACDRRGPVLADRPTGCGCPPLRRCADGRDVSLNDCLVCVRGDPGA